ncbi:hypothetical protein PUW61_08915 [Lactobacillus crispatus]|uniref:hypothetical protein n=1 Tax=Lactobacillus crispatus TaxID=47770 RepID=UPI0023A993C6|nr:hypothetical protein [Lactobacillus crispatus]WEB23782.1 hypothetical protein PUW61_08915 [Lactobacillus crispatus]
MKKLDKNKLNLVLFTILTIVWGYIFFDNGQAFLKIGTIFLEHPSKVSISNIYVSALVAGGSFAITLGCVIKAINYLVKVTSDDEKSS